ncbi:MAG: hypothetical protein KGN34_00045 [Sphingomonadales bacterium]|nr:hypothetical protein [Sphingomonadales bacterium]
MHPTPLRKTGIALLAVLTLAACGVRRDLKPVAGKALPVAPHGAGEKPGADDLLTPTSQERPGRNVELRTRSEPRTDDPYDLPPKN